MTPTSGGGRVWLQTLSSTIAVALLSIVSSILTARILGPEGRGLMAATLLIANLASGIAQFGLANSLVYHNGKGDTRLSKRLFIWTIAIVALSTVPLSLIGTNYIYPDTYHSSTPLIVYSSISTSLLTFASTSLQIHPDLRAFNISRAVPALAFATYITILWISNITSDYTELILFQTSISLILAAYLVHHLWCNLPSAQEEVRPRRKLPAKALIGYAAKYHGTILLSLLLLNIDKLFLINEVDASQFGLYALAFATTRIVSSIQDAASLTTFAKFAGKNNTALASAVYLSFRISFAPMLGVATIIALAAPFFIPLVFGQAFAGMTVAFILLTFEAVVGAASWTLAQRFNAGGSPGLILFRQVTVALPLLAAVNFLPAENAANWMAALMLAAALLRLGITVAMTSTILKEPIPPLFPTATELKEIIKKVRDR